MSDSVNETGTIATAPGGMQRLKAYYLKNEPKIAVLFFIGGFVFDLFAVGRADSWEAIGQQALYLAIVAVVLTQMFLDEGRPARELGDAFVLRRWYYQYRPAIVNFFLGTLLNVYTIFFFKSSSLLVSFSFLALLVFLLLLNEFNRFKWLGLSFKFALLSLCGLSFWASVVPIFVGSIGLVVFLFSMLAGCVPVLALASWIRRRVPDLDAKVRQQILVPFGLVLCVFLLAYLFRVIPPVPLSLPFIGVYHTVEKTEQGYRLSHERSWWRFWQNGDQKFAAQPGDKVYVFFRLFSPTNFSDQVSMRWYWKDPVHGWTAQDSIPIKIVGGRLEGFRGYGVKSKYQPGEWKVQVETADEREIGRIYFELETVPAAPRRLQVDVQ
jgi:hypothetical protein